MKDATKPMTNPMTEHEWEERYHWLPTDLDGTAELLSPSNLSLATRKLLNVADPHYIWSQLDADNGGYEIVPGLRRAIGWYVTDRPWETGEERVVLPPTTE